MYDKRILRGIYGVFAATSEITGILRREQTIDSAGDALIGVIIRTANGHLTAAEALDHREFSMTKLYRSA